MLATSRRRSAVPLNDATQARGGGLGARTGSMRMNLPAPQVKKQHNAGGVWCEAKFGLDLF